jgi:hypothetical protein
MTKRVVALDACVLIHAVQGLRGAFGDHAREAERSSPLLKTSLRLVQSLLFLPLRRQSS